MATDIYIHETSHDLVIDEDTKELRLTANLEELTRQRLAINLKLFQGEWYADINLGTPYFQEIYGKNTKVAADLAIKDVILSTDGIVTLNTYSSSIDKTTRKLTVSFTCTTESGEIISFEETV